MIVARGDESIEPGDRVIMIGSPEAARAWSDILSQGRARASDIVVFGGGDTGTTIGRLLLEEGMRVRIVEASTERARFVAEALPEARVFNATATDAEFIERERIGTADAAIITLASDEQNLYAATMAKLHGATHDRGGDRAGLGGRARASGRRHRRQPAHGHRRGDRPLRARSTDPADGDARGDRFEILDITVREDSQLIGTPFRQLPMTGLIGAIVRGETAIFPHGDDTLMPGDRAIIFAEAGARLPGRARSVTGGIAARPGAPAGCGSASTSVPSPA